MSRARRQRHTGRTVKHQNQHNAPTSGTSGQTSLTYDGIVSTDIHTFVGFPTFRRDFFSKSVLFHCFVGNMSLSLSISQQYGLFW